MKEQNSANKCQEMININFNDPSTIKKLKMYENIDEILTLTYDEQNMSEGEYNKLFQVTVRQKILYIPFSFYKG